VQAKLVVIAGDEQSQRFELHLPAIIGRSRTTDVTLGHPLVSRQHCELYEASGKLMLRDLGSLNGTFVNDTRLCDQPIAIEPGERFTVGTITLQADYHVGRTAAPGEEVCADSEGSAWPGATIKSSLDSDGELRFDGPHESRLSGRRPPGSQE
jgi:pSer/pThr/pTyr-binding forkhead associated (FHA) protein